MKIPLKQGLKHSLPHQKRKFFPRLSEDSIKTRIEARCPISPTHPLSCLSEDSIKTRIEADRNDPLCHNLGSLSEDSIKTRIEAHKENRAP